MPLGTEVGLVLLDTVFDVDPATPRKKGTPTPIQFLACLLCPNGWMDENVAWYGSRPRHRPHCTRRGPSSRERGTATPLFSAHVYCGHGRPSQLLLSSCFVLCYAPDHPYLDSGLKSHGNCTNLYTVFIFLTCLV